MECRGIPSALGAGGVVTLGGNRTRTFSAWAVPLPVRAHSATVLDFSLLRPRLKPRLLARLGQRTAHQRQHRRELVAAALQLRRPQLGQDGFQRRQRPVGLKARRDSELRRLLKKGGKG